MAQHPMPAANLRRKALQMLLFCSARLLLGGGLVTAANVLLQSPWLEAKLPPEPAR